MKLPNWFKIIWWVLLLIAISYAVTVRFESYKSGDVTGLDALVLLIWIALALVPVYQEIHILGFKFKQEKEPLKPQPHVDSDKETVSQLTNTKVKELLKSQDNQILVEQIDILKKAVSDLTPTPEEKEELLFRYLADSQITVIFERTYSTIFGSQLNALQYLNGKAGTFKDISELRPFYDSAKAENPQFYGTYTFESWLGYMVSAVLVIVDGSMVDITIRGQEFLKYLINQRYSFQIGG